MIHAQGYIDEAVEIYEKCLEVRKRVLGDEHPFTLSNMHHLAEAWKDQGKDSEALALMEDCCRMRRDTLGVEHYSFIVSDGCLQAWRREAEEVSQKDLD